jgi:pentatricopeptide repeat protein
MFINDVFAGLWMEFVVLVLAITIHALVFRKLGIRVRSKRFSKDLYSKDVYESTPEEQETPKSKKAVPAAATKRSAVALRNAIKASDLKAALPSLRELAPELAREAPSGGIGETPSTAPRALLTDLWKLAFDSMAVPTLVHEFDVCGLLKSWTLELAFAEAGRLEDVTALKMIEELANTRKVVLTSGAYTSLVQAFVQAKDLKSAERVLAAATASKKAVTLAYNNMVKGLLHNGKMDGAKATLSRMLAAGVKPDAATFNPFLSATIQAGDHQGMWAFLTQMKTCCGGVAPNRGTYLILLKEIKEGSSKTDVAGILKYMNFEGMKMDDVTFTSLLDALIGCGRKDLLPGVVQRQKGADKVVLTSAQGFGTLIRAYGVLGNAAGVWEAWREMTRLHVPLTKQTVGNMVAALAASEGPESAYEFVKELAADPQARPLINSVTCVVLLKVFRDAGEYDRVFACFEEMGQEGFEASTQCYNVLFDTCARSNKHTINDKVPTMLEEMKAKGLEPDIVTYSTMLKNYCNHGQMDLVFKLMGNLKIQKVKLDEIMYNTVIHGCARSHLFERGLEVLEQMEEEGVPPSNYTLTALVRLAKATQRLDKALELCESLPRKYNFQANQHTYHALISACCRKQEKADESLALRLLGKMAHQGVRPQLETYLQLIRTVLASGRAGAGLEAAGLVRAAVGLPGVHPALTAFEGGNVLRCEGAGLDKAALTEILQGIAQCGDQGLAVKLARELHWVHGTKLEHEFVSGFGCATWAERAH